MSPSFSIFAVGSGGGPLETNLSSYLCKTYDATWDGGDIFALEGGSGVGTLTQLFTNDRELFRYFGFAPSIQPIIAATRVFSAVHSYLISHAHFDHISGLVLSAGSFTGGRRKRIAAMRTVLTDIETVFSGRLWPKLVSWKETDEDSRYLLTILHQDRYQKLCRNVSVRMMPLTHGRTFADAKDPYESSAFFIRHDVTKRTFVFLGDVEPDSLSLKPQTINVWQAAARLMPEQLAAIFLECSWSSDRDDTMLFGHLSPKHVLCEMEAFADEVLSLKNNRRTGLPDAKRHRKDRRNALQGLTLYLIHCKAALNDMHDQVQLVGNQVRALILEQELGIEVVAVTQGMRIEL